MKSALQIVAKVLALTFLVCLCGAGIFAVTHAFGPDGFPYGIIIILIGVGVTLIIGYYRSVDRPKSTREHVADFFRFWITEGLFRIVLASVAFILPSNL